MKSRILRFTLISMFCLMAWSCEGVPPNDVRNDGLPNPASVYCEQNGGRLELRADDEGGEQGICVFPDGSECEEWLFFRGECASASQADEAADPVEAPAVMPADSIISSEFTEDDYQGWWTYQNDDYGFSLRLPEDWSVDEEFTSDALMSGHFLRLHPGIESESKLSIRVSVRRWGEETLLWPTGVGEGDFVPMGTLNGAGLVLRRIGFQCPTGELAAIKYLGPEETGPNIHIDELEFGFIFFGSEAGCQGAVSMEDKTVVLGDMVVASLTLF